MDGKQACMLMVSSLIACTGSDPMHGDNFPLLSDQKPGARPQPLPDGPE